MIISTGNGALPRERIFALGARALNDAELVALLLGTGRHGEPVLSLAQRLLSATGDLRALGGAHPRELTEFLGLGEVKAARVAAAAELGKRISLEPWLPGASFTTSRQVFAHFHPMLREEKQELFIAVYLDARNRLIGEVEITRGSLVASLVHPREVFRPAIRMAAAALICVHNHPSGDPAHSAEDLAITRRIFDAGRTIGIQMLDHVIVGNGRYTSFMDLALPPYDQEARVAHDPGSLHEARAPGFGALRGGNLLLQWPS